MEAAVQGLAAIVMNAYRGAAESRGARGTAGSGSGTRTLVDGLSLSMAHNHWLAVNHLDLHASLPLQIPDHEDEDEGGTRGGGGRGGGEGGADGAEECGRGGLSRGFEAPPLDAAKVKWIRFSAQTDKTESRWLKGRAPRRRQRLAIGGGCVCISNPPQQVIFPHGLVSWELRHQTLACRSGPLCGIC